MLLDGGKQNLGVGPAPEDMTLRDKFRTQAPEIIDFAVEGDHIASAMGRHRLMALRRQIDDRYAAVAQRQPRLRIDPQPIVIRPAMLEDRKSTRLNSSH